MPIDLTNGDDDYEDLAGDDAINGLNGNDTIDGLGGNDTINGGKGHDDIAGDDGNDTLNGAAGNDTLFGDADDDKLLGGGGNDTLDGGDGNDTLSGGSGNDLFLGGLGDDVIQTGEGEDHVIGGLGDDTVDLSGKIMGEGWFSVEAHDNAQGIFALIDGDANFGAIVVDNGPADDEGVIFLEDLNNALQLDYAKPEGGMGVNGTQFDDTFLIDAGEQGWIQVRPGEGADTIQIEGDSGTVRLDYSDHTDSIFANLRFGIVVDGTPGFVVDRITGGGKVRELRATDYDDQIFGSNADERFILRAGEDFLNGRRGEDTVRYDRNGVEDVNIDLGAKVGTGIWNGQAFNHTLVNIEHIRGSKTGNDVLAGNGQDNDIFGQGGKDELIGRAGNDQLNGGTGNDTLTGGGGNDTLDGGDGADKLIFKDGNGNDDVFDFGNGNDKIVLKGVSDITDFADLQANHLSNSDPSGSYTVIDYGVSDTITLWGVDSTTLTAGDFVF